MELYIPFITWGKVNFDYLPRRREGSEKLKKGGGSMVQGQVFLKGKGLTLFLFSFFKVYHFYAFEEKLFFSVTIIL